MIEEQLKSKEEKLLKEITAIRNNLHLTQRGLCSIIDMVQPSLAKIEKGKLSPQLNTLLKILEPMGYTVTFQKMEECKKIR